ncbi:hypothetical protein SAMD00019534_087160, partial [Acytostelium subglobosum LB1]|uniref:hypothetical protein n=1 Tax=Acytostelium subglobosum LB1 TaxID=1410327 RepID=UPI00064515B0
MYKIIVILIILGCCLIDQSQQYGESYDGIRPRWQEREAHAWINAIRMAPQQFTNNYYPSLVNDQAMTEAVFPPVKPVYFSSVVYEASKAHSQDMATKHCLGFNSCDGTTFDDRIDAMITLECQGEQVVEAYASMSDPKAMPLSKYWVCDGLTSSPCISDEQEYVSSSTQFRANIMNPNMSAGAFAHDMDTDSDNSIWTMDMTAGNCPSNDSPIFGGSHTVDSVGMARNVTYLANWYGSAPSSAKLYIRPINITQQPVAYDLYMGLGNATAGTYMYNSMQIPECALYLYEFTVGNTKYRYPTTGALATSFYYSYSNSNPSICPAWVSTDIFNTTQPSTTSSTSTTSTTTSTTSSNPTTTTSTTSTTSSNPSSTTSTTSTTSANPSLTTSTTSSTTTTTANPSLGSITAPASIPVLLFVLLVSLM